MEIDMRILLIAVLVSFISGIGLSDLQWKNKLSELEKQATQNQLDAVAAANAEHNKLVSKLEEKNRETEKKLAEINTVADATAATGDSLQQHFTDSLRDRCTKTNPTITTRDRAAAATDELVQAYVFRIVTDRAIAYAKIADTNRIRGLSCQQSYDALRLSCSVKF